jgi:hypothetical protein
MRYKRDLLKNNDKSIFSVVLGFIFILLSVVWIITRLAENELIRPFDWLFFVIFTLNGLTHIFAGFGISIERFFGKAFVQIDSNSIDIKLSIFKKEQNLYWQDIQSIDYVPHKFTFQMTNGTKVFSFTNFGNSCISEIKNIISKNADSNKIKYNFN